MIFCGAVLWCDWILSLFVLSVPGTYSHIAALCGLVITNDTIIITAYCLLLQYIWADFYWILWDLHRVNELKYLNWTEFGETKWLTYPLSPPAIKETGKREVACPSPCPIKRLLPVINYKKQQQMFLRWQRSSRKEQKFGNHFLFSRSLCGPKVVTPFPIPLQYHQVQRKSPDSPQYRTANRNRTVWTAALRY